jgi:hypothetical protein
MTTLVEGWCLGQVKPKVYMDLSGLSGYRGLLDLIALINNYGSLLRPDTIVVKSGALKHFAHRVSRGFLGNPGETVRHREADDDAAQV